MCIAQLTVIISCHTLKKIIGPIYASAAFDCINRKLLVSSARPIYVHYTSCLGLRSGSPGNRRWRLLKFFLCCFYKLLHVSRIVSDSKRWDAIYRRGYYGHIPDNSVRTVFWMVILLSHVYMSQKLCMPGSCVNKIIAFLCWRTLNQPINQPCTSAIWKIFKMVAYDLLLLPGYLPHPKYLITCKNSIIIVYTTLQCPSVWYKTM